jgi:hypothetical protein
MFSLRDSLWFKFAHRVPPENSTFEEILIASLVALVLLLGWFIVRRWFFLIGQRAQAARITALIFCCCWGLAWLVGSLDLMGFRSSAAMTIILVLSAGGCFTYLAHLRKK